MGFLYFLGLLLAGAVLLYLVLRLTTSHRAKGGEIPLVLVGAASGQVEANAWKAALRSGGVWSMVKNIGDVPWYGANSYAYEVWVREKDAERARAMLNIR